MKPPAWELYADDTGNASSSNSEVQNATKYKKNRYWSQRMPEKKRKTAAKTHEEEVDDQSDVGSCTSATNGGLQLKKKNPHNSTTSLKEVLGVKDATASLETTVGDRRWLSMVS